MYLDWLQGEVPNEGMLSFPVLQSADVTLSFAVAIPLIEDNSQDDDLCLALMVYHIYLYSYEDMGMPLYFL